MIAQYPFVTKIFLSVFTRSFKQIIPSEDRWKEERAVNSFLFPVTCSVNAVINYKNNVFANKVLIRKMRCKTYSLYGNGGGVRGKGADCWRIRQLKGARLEKAIEITTDILNI